MSTYLLAFIVSNFKSQEADLSLFHGKPVRTYASPHLISRGFGVYPSIVAAKVLNFYEDYFQIEYPLPKMDSVAIPNGHFAAGAMENYGANTYREKLLLNRGNLTTESERYSITSIMYALLCLLS